MSIASTVRKMPALENKICWFSSRDQQVGKDTLELHLQTRCGAITVDGLDVKNDKIKIATAMSPADEALAANGSTKFAEKQIVIINLSKGDMRILPHTIRCGPIGV